MGAPGEAGEAWHQPPAQASVPAVERAAIDRRVADVFVQAERRKFLAALEAEEQAAQAAGEG